MKVQADVIIVGTGVGGLMSALSLPEDKQILMITKSDMESSDSFLAQGGICVLRDEGDYESYFEDTMRAGHYENSRESVEIMIRSSKQIISDLIGYGVRFEQKNGALAYTREGGHSKPRVLFHADITGKEITSKLLQAVKQRPNVTILEHTTMTDLMEQDGRCCGILAKTQEQDIFSIDAKDTILATGGIGGLYKHSTNFPHLTGDAISIAKRHGIALQNLNYVQIHPTTLYSKEAGRRFLISESVRGEGAVLLNAKKERFTDELQPRDRVTAEIHKQMEADGTDFVWLSMEHMDPNVIQTHFPNIYQHCLKQGYDVMRECIPVVPAQHYFMGGVKVDINSKTSMEHLYAVGETSCNGVHGANRLASNSLLESLVFAKRAAQNITCSDQSETKVFLPPRKLSERMGKNERYYNKIKCR